MGDPAGLLLSVRGEARRMVPPDCAVVTAGIACLRGSKAEAVRAAAAELDGLTADLAATAAVAVVITVRAFGLLDALGEVLAAHEAVSVHHVDWQVDWDNPAWPDVRAAAIRAAIRKGSDYAAALGGSLRTVEHIADAGLLGGDGAQPRFTGAGPMRAAAAAGGESDAPSLDPVPQELVAIIEARFTAGDVPLTAP